jgi:hypothetical protein
MPQQTPLCMTKMSGFRPHRSARTISSVVLSGHRARLCTNGRCVGMRAIRGLLFITSCSLMRVEITVAVLATAPLSGTSGRCYRARGGSASDGPSRPCDVDWTHRQIPRERNRRAREGEGGPRRRIPGPALRSQNAKRIVPSLARRVDGGMVSAKALKMAPAC